MSNPTMNVGGYPTPNQQPTLSVVQPEMQQPWLHHPRNGTANDGKTRMQKMWRYRNEDVKEERNNETM